MNTGFSPSDIKTGEVFSVVLPERFGNENPHPVIILGVKRINGKDHYRVIPSMTGGLLTNVIWPLPFSIIISAGNTNNIETNIKKVFKKHFKKSWKSALQYDYSQMGETLKYIIDFGDSERTIFTRADLIKTLIEEDENPIKQDRSKIITIDNLINGEEYLLEKYNESHSIGDIDIVKVIRVVTTEDGGYQVTYSFPEENNNVVQPNEYSIKINGDGVDTKNNIQHIFYKRPTIKEMFEPIRNERLLLIKALKNTGREISGTGNPYRIAKKGGKRKTQRQRRMAKKSRKQRKN